MVMKKPRKPRKVGYRRWLVTIHPELFQALTVIKAERKAQRRAGATISDLMNEALLYWIKLVINKNKNKKDKA